MSSDIDVTSDHLSPHDTAIWQTLQILFDLDAGRVAQRPAIYTSFALGSRDEQVLATGSYRMENFRAAGDGTYTHKSGFFLGGGGLGLALGAGIAASRAIGNGVRKAHARAKLEERWMTLAEGQVWISEDGAYFAHPQGLRPLSWWALDAVEMIAPERAHFTTGEMGEDVRWIVNSHWAELFFVLWARARHPQHRQFIDNSWIPTGWEERVRRTRYALPQR